VPALAWSIRASGRCLPLPGEYRRSGIAVRLAFSMAWKGLVRVLKIAHDGEDGGPGTLLPGRAHVGRLSR
jgi:hypothetical protein